MSRGRLVIGGLLYLVATASLARTEVWFGPHGTMVDHFNAFEPSRYAEWQALSYSIDVYFFHLSKITTDFNYAEQPQANYFTQTQLQQAATMLHQVGVKIAFGLGGPIGDCRTGDPHSVGWSAATAQANTIQAYVDKHRAVTGGSDDGVYALSIDGPVEATHYDGRDKTCTFSNEQSLQAYASYVAELRNRFPNARIGVTTNFANMRYDGKTVHFSSYLRNWDYRDVLNQLVARANAVDVTIDFLHIDHPADLVVDINSTVPNRGNWGQLRDLANQARSLGLRVNMFFNTDNGLHWNEAIPFPFLTVTNNKYSPAAAVTQTMRDRNKLYATNTLRYAARWKDELVPLDIASFISWHNYPYSVFQDSAYALGDTYRKYAAANVADAINTIFNRRVCSPYEYKAQRTDLDAYFSQFSGDTLFNNAYNHWGRDGAFELIGVSSDPFALYPRLDPWGNTVAPTSVSLCRTTPPNTCTEAEYFRRRPDVGSDYRPRRWGAMQHWDMHGRHEGMCRPSLPQENCSSTSYFMQRPDVQANSGGNAGFAATHWNGWGRWEGMCKPF
jgi:hypothetical protein